MQPIVSTASSELGSVAEVLPECLRLITSAPDGERIDHVIVIVIDGLGWHNLHERAGHARTLSRSVGRAISTVFPTTTAAALTSFTTGLAPGQHGIVGYSVREPDTGRVINQISGWESLRHEAGWQRAPTVFETARSVGVRASAIGARSFASSGFTRNVLRGATYVSADEIEDRLLAATNFTSGPARSLSYVYIHELDKAGHRWGWRSSQWLDALEHLDAALAASLRRLPPRTGVVVTADHGMIDVDPSDHVLIDRDQLEEVELVAGEPRMLHLYLAGDVEPQARERVAQRWRSTEGARAEVLTRDEAISADLFGSVDPVVEARIGDVIVAARGSYAYYDARIREDRARLMIGQHGSLTETERLVPLITAGAINAL